MFVEQRKMFIDATDLIIATLLPFECYLQAIEFNGIISYPKNSEVNL